MGRLVVLALVPLALAVEVGAAPLRPALQVVERAPLVVRGVGFVRGESVTVRASVGDRTGFKRVVAGAAGSFTVRFATLAVRDRCSEQIFLTAVGSRGSRATYKQPLPQCPPLQPAER